MSEQEENCVAVMRDSKSKRTFTNPQPLTYETFFVDKRLLFDEHLSLAAKGCWIILRGFSGESKPVDMDYAIHCSGLSQEEWNLAFNECRDSGHIRVEKISEDLDSIITTVPKDWRNRCKQAIKDGLL